ncbi:unnamed protein product [Rotaria socialis]|uniref:Uncharacterized protein n=1 Tax=Rotaria socialis TaxID=392032 RepID=A0A821MT16_9BILA|nr:unnamed protein product [Rotaria socialis]CAF4774288.1 unnamed protein product [Rotaria socialis]
MATVAKNKGFPDVHNAENWKYTTTNNIKKINGKDEAKRFISGTIKIWKLHESENGDAFTQSLLKAIEDLHETYTTGLEYTDEKGDICYLLFLIQRLADGSSIQITHTHHKLSRSGIRKNSSDHVQMEECNTKQWLIQRACSELHLSDRTTKAMMSYNNNALVNNLAKYSSQERLLTRKELNDITLKIDSTPPVGVNHYHIMHKQKHGKQFLSSIPEISNFCQYIPDPDEFVEKLAKLIENLNQHKELVYEVQYSNVEKCFLRIIVSPDDQIVHILVQISN